MSGLHQVPGIQGLQVVRDDSFSWQVQNVSVPPKQATDAKGLSDFPAMGMALEAVTAVNQSSDIILTAMLVSHWL
jgi:hypothetical protein